MARVTLKTLFDEIQKKDALAEMRFEFLKEQMKNEFTLVRKELKVIRDQTAHVTERVSALEHVRRDTPSA